MDYLKYRVYVIACRLVTQCACALRTLRETYLIPWFIHRKLLLFYVSLTNHFIEASLPLMDDAINIICH